MTSTTENTDPDDLSMQIGWNQLFQQFVSELFNDTEDKHPPVVTIEELGNQGIALGSVLHTLRSAVDFVRSKYAQNYTPAQLPETNHLSVLAEGLALYLKSALSPPQYSALSSQVAAASEHWLLSFMNLQSANDTFRGIFTQNDTHARLFACRVALHKKYVDYAERGYQVLAERGQPVFYYTSSALTGSFHSLGLPTSSFRYVKNEQEFEAAIVRDQEAGLLPLLLLASAGSGTADNLVSLHAISQKHQIFTHVEGDDLALLASPKLPKSLQVVKLFDSFSISPGEWYGLATPATCIFFRDEIPAGTVLDTEDMAALSLWVTMQNVGRKRLSDILSIASSLSKELHESLAKIPSIAIYSAPESLSVVFRYHPTTRTPQEFHQDFLNSLNSQVLIDLSDTALPLALGMTYVQKHNCLHFHPLSHPLLMQLESVNVKNFVEQLRRAINCINATLSCAPDFAEEIQTYKGLQCVFVRNFVGIGAVRYLPNFLRGLNLSPEVSQEVDLVNSHLARELALQDSLFSEGTTTDGRTCVCLGVETKPIDKLSPSQYTKMIAQTIDKLQLHKQIEEKFGSFLVQGITNAEKFMKLETEYAEQQRGFVRAIPVVGSVLNWWSPPPPPPPVGKTFDIGSTSLKTVVFSPRKPTEGGDAATPSRADNSQANTPAQANTPSPLAQPATTVSGTPVPTARAEELAVPKPVPFPDLP